MPTSRDQRAQMVPLLQAAEIKLLKELEAEQITHVDLAEYQISSPRYQALMAAMDNQVKYQWPGYTEAL
jgi:hypothetical protein